MSILSLVPITDADLDRWQAEADAATHGPWFVTPEHNSSAGQEIVTDPEADCCGAGEVVTTGSAYPRGCNSPEETMRFIAHSRTLVPLLIAEVRRLRATP